MNPDFNLLLAFTTGLFGALHCLGMCGGLAGGYFLQRRRPLGLPSQLLYHGGRLLLYSLLGIAGALAGRVLVQTGWIGKGQGLLMMGAGLVILFLGLRQLRDWARSRREGPGPGSRQEVPLMPLGQSCYQPREHSRDHSRDHSWDQPHEQPRGQRRDQSWGRAWGQLRGQPQGQARVRPGLSFAAPLFFGMLNGLMPCGLVFAMAIKAAATADPVQAGWLMLAFGLGTLPMMGAVTSLAAWIGTWSTGEIRPGTTQEGLGNRIRSLLAPITGGLVVLMGLWTGYEGLIFFDIMRGLANG